MTIHPRFKFQGNTVNASELLNMVQKIDATSFQFLSEWLNEEDFVFVNTSGSTGIPKKIQLNKKHMIASAKATGTYFNCLEGTKALNCLSAEFIAGKMMWVRALTLGWDLDLTSPTGNPLKNNTTTYDFSAMVPLQVEKCLSQLSQLKTLIVGGAPVSASLQNRIKQISTEVYSTYGMTETITHIAVKRLNHISKESYFETLPNVEISLDERACLVIDAPNISEKKVATNDLVKLHSKTTFEWLGRFDSIINSGGVKLVPEVIERKLQDLIPHRFFITSAPDESLGEKLILMVEGKEDKELLQKIKSTETFNKYELPKKVVFLQEFIETSSGKIHRLATKAEAGI